MELLCKWCGETKEETNFVKRNTKLPFSQSNVRNCKECNHARNQLRYKDPEIRDKQLVANAKWRRGNSEKMRGYEVEFYKRNPNNLRARSRIGSLVRSGLLERQPCCVCGSNEQVEAHHNSYAEPHWETVQWLCKKHHESWHDVIDPIKSVILVEPLAEVIGMRHEATEIQKQITELRKTHQKLIADANATELQVWNKVVEAVTPLFKEFCSKP